MSRFQLTKPAPTTTTEPTATQIATLEPVAPVAEQLAPPAPPVTATPATPEAAPAAANAAEVTNDTVLTSVVESGKAIRRIVIFYRDGSFVDYQPEA
ncbi:MAG: hypothetical protein EOO63_15045 [Hymenobacter sp.]|nr:MAG: hypothetical protein EOO63_15045 [Hymenobacter sp.]